MSGLHYLGDEVLTAGWGAAEVEGARHDEGGREGGGVEAEFRGGVFEGAGLGCVVAVPAAGGEARGGGAEDAGGLPGVYGGGYFGGEVGTAVYDPGDGVGEGRWGEETGAEGRVGAGTTYYLRM